MTSRFISRLALISILPASLALVGCGDDDSSGGAGGAAGSGGAAQNIVEIASGNTDFETLTQAVVAADLAGALSGPGPFTVFAPTDDAFARLPSGTLDTLLQPANKAQLANILQYHVVSGKVMAADVVDLTSATALNGATISISVSGGVVKLNGTAKVVTTDIAASNGVIHVIDQVLLPPDE